MPALLLERSFDSGLEERYDCGELSSADFVAQIGLSQDRVKLTLALPGLLGYGGWRCRLGPNPVQT